MFLGAYPFYYAERVGNIAGETGLVAISNASMMSFVINSVCIGVTMGGTVLIAQYKGAAEQQGQTVTVWNIWLQC